MGGSIHQDILPALRHDYDCPNRAAVAANRRTDADVGFQHAVVTSLAGAMKNKYYWPFLVGRPIFRNEDLVFVIHGLEA